MRKSPDDLRLIAWVTLAAAEPLITAAERALPAHSAAVADFVPKGWRNQASAVGDLNRDGRPDRVLVVGLAGGTDGTSGTTEISADCFTAPALLVVLYAERSGYRLGPINHSLYPRNCEIAAPFPEIRNGILVVNLNWRDGWAVDTTFRFRADARGRLMLTGFDYELYSRTSILAGNRVSENYLTGQRIIYVKPGRSLYVETHRERIARSKIPFEQASLEEDDEGDFRPFKAAPESR